MIEKTYYYHSLVFTMHRMVYGLLLLSVISIWMLSLWYLLHYGFLFRAMLHLSSYVTFVALCLAGLFKITFGRSHETRFIINDEMLVKSTPFKVRAVRFDEITSIGLAIIPGIGGGVSIKGATGRIVLPFIINGIGSLIEDIEHILHVNGMTDKVSMPRLAWLKKQGYINDVVQNRAATDLSFLTRVSMAMAGAGAVLAVPIWHLSFWQALATTAISAVFAVLVYTAALFVLNIRMQLYARERQGEIMQTFETVLWYCVLAGVALYSLAGIIFKSYFL